MEDIELDVGGTKFKGVYIAILFSFASTIAGGIWTASEFFNRLDDQEQAVQEAVQNALVLDTKFGSLSDTVTAELNTFETDISNVRQSLDDNNVSQLQGKLAELGTNLEAIMKRQGELLDLRDKINAIEKRSGEQEILLKSELDKLKQYSDDMKRIKREIDDLWNGMDALSNPLSWLYFI